MGTPPQDTASAYPTPAAVRAAARSGALTTGTAGLANGFVQANLVILPGRDAAEMLAFCRQNPGPCPLLEVTGPGDPEPRRFVPGGDLRTDLPRYRVFRHGELVDSPTDIRDLWTGDMVGFLLGCSFTFEGAFQEAGIPVRHIDEGRVVPMFRTNIECVPAGRFAGPMVVSMRPLAPAHVEQAASISARYPLAHGGPVHIGDPAAIGIRDLGAPDFGEAVTIHPGEVPAFWACGATPVSVALAARLPLMIAHASGHMLVTDVADSEIAVA